MKKIVLIVFSFVFLAANAQGLLKGNVSEEYIPKGFFGSWGVISKLNSSNNPTMFNYESRDIWTLSGYSDTLILENLQSGAHSEIKIKDKTKDNRTLEFERQKTVSKNGTKTVYKETVKFTLLGNNFTGTDNFVVETYDENNKLLSKNQASYSVAGVKISGKAPGNN